MESRQTLASMKMEKLLNKYPFAESYLSAQMIEIDKSLTLSEILDSVDEDEKENKAIDADHVLEGLELNIKQMLEFLGDEDDSVKSLTIIAGTNKFGEQELFDEFTINKSEIISIVGPTGSGKSRLLGDIEWTAQKDTPTSRAIKINGEKPDMKWRFSTSNKMVAQLSQNMNFVMDLTVYEFLELHAKSRFIEDREAVIEKITEAANNLAGEKFDLNTPVTSLSGGQSRALMIADTAILSTSPIILIDEIENAGIDRKKALAFLVDEQKIVLMATHDPMLALMADKRIVISNGGIDKILVTTNEEKELLAELEKMDSVIQNMRSNLRYGRTLKKGE